jgi:hypothetical protein
VFSRYVLVFIHQNFICLHPSHLNAPSFKPVYMPLSVFSIFTVGEFARFLHSTTFSRKITFIQNHHTLKPDYTDFGPNRHMALLEGMRRFHVNTNHWSDIGQNITTFPDGTIGYCRPLDIKPAGIFGANTGAVCIEHLGNFDRQHDQMTDEQKDCIVELNALLCKKFGLRPVPEQVVYHHWFDTSGSRFTAHQVNSGRVLSQRLQKTCPGTNFFSDGNSMGNTIVSAQANFYPLIANAMASPGITAPPTITAIVKTVNASVLNVRSGRGVQFNRTRKLFRNAQVQVFEERDGWSRISAGVEEWVSSDFLT